MDSIFLKPLERGRSIFSQAEGLGVGIDEEDDLFDLGDDDDAVVDDLFAGLSDDDDDDDEDILHLMMEEDEDEVPETASSAARIPAGRVEMAQRVRRTLYGIASPAESHETGFFAGYLACAKDAGLLDESSEREAYGGVLKWITRGLGGAAKIALAGGQGFLGDQKLEDVARDVGAGVRGGLGVPRQGAGRDVGEALVQAASKGAFSAEPAASSAASVEATKEELPPVYVADSEGAEEYLISADDAGYDPDLSMPFDVEEQFGATSRVGLVDRMRRERSRSAVSSAMAKGARRLSRSERSAPRVFVRDRGADPLLYRGGEVREPVYGALQLVPCPSCARVKTEVVYGGSVSQCLACDSFGAILVPDDDVESYAGISYGAVLLSLLASAAAAGAGAANRAGMLEGPKSRARSFADERGWGIADSEALSEGSPSDEV